MRFGIFLSPRLWFAGFLIWAAALCALSAMTPVMPHDGPEIPHLDKVVHFVYFMGGSFAFATWTLLRNETGARPPLRILFAVLLFAAIGALDEYHQTFTPGRSGNDPFDWLADVLGSLTGVMLANRFHRILLKFSWALPEKSRN